MKKLITATLLMLSACMASVSHAGIIYDLVIDGAGTEGDATLNNLSISGSDTNDYFLWTASETGLTFFQILFSTSDGNLQLDLRQASNNSLFARSSSTSDNETIAFNAIADTSYIIRIFLSGSDNSGTPYTPDQFEDNNRYTSATVIPVPAPNLFWLLSVAFGLVWIKRPRT